MKKMYFLYSIPYIYIAHWIQWFSFSVPATILTYAVLAIPLVLAAICGKYREKALCVQCNVLQFVSNMALTLATNQMNITNELGGTWRGMSGVLYSEHFVMALFLLLVLLQIVTYKVSAQLSHEN